MCSVFDVTELLPSVLRSDGESSLSMQTTHVHPFSAAPMPSRTLNVYRLITTPLNRHSTAGFCILCTDQLASLASVAPSGVLGEYLRGSSTRGPGPSGALAPASRLAQLAPARSFIYRNAVSADSTYLTNLSPTSSEEGGISLGGVAVIKSTMRKCDGLAAAEPSRRTD